MELIPIPKKIEYTAESESKGEFVIEPLYPGYGITVGNMLRRVLLSSVPGAAINTVKIKGVEHEFSTIDYVKEDMVDIVLNIKQIKLRVEAGTEITPEEPLVLKLNKKGEGKVTAGDIECPAQVKIVNKSQLIATLTDKAAEFEAEFTVEVGRGYLPVESFKGEKLSIGHMAVDAIFTPINEVSIKTEHVRVGEMTNWDKLTLTVETDGSVSPEEAYQTAADILYEQVKFLKDRGSVEEEEEKVEKEPAKKEEEEDKKEEDENKGTKKQEMKE